jgi:hypothetical protein
MGVPLLLRENFSGRGANMEYVPVPVLFVLLVRCSDSTASFIRTDQVDARRFQGFLGQDRDIGSLHG